MYKIILSCFVIVSCFVFFANGQEDHVAPQTQTECDKFLSCMECLETPLLNCTFCTSDANNGTCTNQTVCPDPSVPAWHNKTQCSSVVTPTTKVTTISTAETSPATATVTKTESTVTEASSPDASESSTEPSKPSPAPSGRHFDPPSFIGGTVLSLGLLAIVYVGFKFYKARTERNYHTL